MFRKLSAVFLIAALLCVTGCAAHVHRVGQGPQTPDVKNERQLYALWGLVPLNNVDTHAMANGATDYEIRTAVTPSDLFFTTFGGLGLLSFRTVTVSGAVPGSGWGGVRDVSIDELIVAPEAHIGSKVRVSAEIYDIVREGGGVIGRSFTISLTSQARPELLKCEFERGKESPPYHLRDGQLVTIIGVVDIVQGEAMLRRCRVE